MKRLLIASTALGLVAGPTLAAQDPGQPRGEAVEHEREAQEQAYTEDHPWVGLPVHDAEGGRIGSVGKVRIGGGADAQARTAEGETTPDQPDLPVSALIIETGGFLGVGDREVRIEPDRAELVQEDGDERVQLDMTEDQVEALPEAERDSEHETSFRGDAAHDHERTDPTGGRDDQSGRDRGSDRDARDQTADNHFGDDERDERAQDVEGPVYTDGHHWIGTPVYSSDEERLGNVTLVKARGRAEMIDEGEEVALTDANPEIVTIIVETEGFIGMGDREVEINSERAERTLVDGEERLILEMDQDTFEDLPEFEALDPDDEW